MIILTIRMTASEKAPKKVLSGIPCSLMRPIIKPNAMLQVTIKNRITYKCIPLIQYSMY